MDFDSPDVEKEFPGLYASEGTSRKKDDDDCKYFFFLGWATMSAQSVGQQINSRFFIDTL